jgi:hypothetical protein
MTEEIQPICDHPYNSLRYTQGGNTRLWCVDCNANLHLPVRQRRESDGRAPVRPVQVQHAPIDTQNWQITAAMVARYAAGEMSVYAPCIICGYAFNRCPHTLDETDVVWTMIKKMGKKERERILNAE